MGLKNEKYSCKGRFLPLKKKKEKFRSDKKKTDTVNVSFAFSFVRTIKDGFILIFLGTTNASPLWVR